MKKIFIISLIITFCTAQYAYLQAFCLLCDQSGEMFNITAIERPDPAEMEFIFDQLSLNEKIELINYNETYKLKYLGTEFCYVSFYDENSYVFVTKDNALLGAINQYKGKKNILLPQDIQPELICAMICFYLGGQSVFSIAACPQLLIAKTRYPYDQELHDALFRACLNGISGVQWFMIWSYRFCN